MAGLSLGLDYLFMLTYPAAICFGLLLTATLVPSRLQRATVLAAYISWLAGAADAAENYHLFQMLVGAQESLHAWAASIAATIKFAVLIPTLALLLFNYLVFGIALRAQEVTSKNSGASV
jgi:high-affinity Fe2+/Pb2+ permease